MKKGLFCLVLCLFFQALVLGSHRPEVASSNFSPNPIHFRPKNGCLADTIPFFWNGSYHIFYLRGNIGKVPWEHIVSTDLIHWKELPTALVPDGEAESPDGENMFTGSVFEKDGTFHIFYTGHNSRNPRGQEFIMHATSPDLIKWTKHPQEGFKADGKNYDNSDFRDPFIFWNDQAKAYWMILCARDSKTRLPVQGVVSSPDLRSWKQIKPLNFEPPLGKGPPECPDLFAIQDRWYLIHSPSAGTTDQRFAQEITGPFHLPPCPPIDTPILYAAKRMFDGKRHILTGWIRDLNGDKDGGGFRWGGDMCIPREVYSGPKGQLYFRPVGEATNEFTFPVLELVRRPAFATAGTEWKFTASGLVGKGGEQGSSCNWEVPADYMLQCKVHLDPGATLSIGFRQQEKVGEGYRLVLRPGAGEAEILGATFRYARKVPLDSNKPFTIQAFIQGSIIECFINDAFVFSCRAYNWHQGKLNLAIQDGNAQITELTVKTQK